jgi:phospholipase/lecithinase/hemolysin
MIRICYALAVASLLFTTSTLADTSFRNLVVFGDSLSDPGNVFAATGGVSQAPYASEGVPDYPYPIGGMTFSNGKTWAMQFADEINLPAAKLPALRTFKATNFAYGTARAASAAGGPYDLSAQVTLYLSTFGGADSDALHSIFIGSNDVRDALVAFQTAYLQVLLGGGTETEAELAGQSAAGTIISDAIISVTNNLISLISNGATQFLIPNVPNIGVIPAVTSHGPQVSSLATLMAYNYNQTLESVLAGIEAAYPVSIKRVDVFSLVTAAVTSPASFGLTNVTDPCLTPDDISNSICATPDDYLFWDGIHPTKAAHALVSKAALSALQ